MNLIKGKKLELWLSQSLEMTAVNSVSFPDEKVLLESYAQLCYQGLNHVPLYIVTDLICCFNPDSLHFRSDADNIPVAIQRYEREFLNRIIQILAATSVLEINYSSSNKWPFQQRLLYLILKPIASCYPQNKVCNPAEIRDLESFADFDGEADAEIDLPTELESFLDNLSNFTWISILNESDLFELRHLDYLKTDHLRLGCRQVIELKEMFNELPAGTLLVNESEDEAESSYIDETHYPAGGLAGLTNKGPIENMVASEMMFLEEQVGHLNLFDLRFLEQQQLYFMRDSGTLKRKRRKIHFIFDMDRLFEQKSRGYEWQFSILSQGICYRLLEDFFTIFEADAVIAELHYIAGNCSSDFIHGEVNIMKLLLKDYSLHDKVHFNVYSSDSLPELEDKKRKSYAVIFAADKLGKWQDFFSNYEKPIIPVYAHFSKGQKEKALSIEGESFDKICGLRSALLQELIR